MQPSQTFAEPQAAAPTEQAPKRQRLHSPILGGGGADLDEDDAPSPAFKRVKSGQGGGGVSSQSQAGTGGQRRGGLRSPLLGGDLDDMDEEEDIQPRGKGFGGGKNKKTEFPHRHHDDNDGHDPGQMTAQSGTGGQKSTGAKGLRSPLLGGSGGDMDDYDDAPRGGQRPAGKPGRLRSPILGGGGGDDYYDDEVFEEVAEEINDPTVLRSPLLAVRTPKAHAPNPAQQQQQQVKQQAPQPVQPPAQTPVNVPEPAKAPFVQGPYTQASGGAPNFALSGGPNYQPFPPNPAPSASNIAAPQAPSQQPAYSPPPAPPAPPGFGSQPGQPGNPGNPSNPGSTGNMPAQAGQMQPSSQMQQPNQMQQATSDSYSYGYQAPLPPAPSAPSTRPNQQALPPNPAAVAPPVVAEPYTKSSQIPTPGSGASASASAPASSSLPAPTKPSPRATGTKFDADGGEEEAPKLKGMRGSKLLGDVSDDPIGPLDRRSRFSDRRTETRGNDRRGTKNTLAALHQDDDEADNLPVGRGGYAASGGMSGGGAPAGSNSMAPLLMATAVIALIAKGYYVASFMGKPGVLAANMPATIDQVTTMLVLVGIILYAMKAMQKH